MKIIGMLEVIIDGSLKQAQMKVNEFRNRFTHTEEYCTGSLHAGAGRLKRRALQ